MWEGWSECKRIPVEGDGSVRNRPAHLARLWLPHQPRLHAVAVQIHDDALCTSFLVCRCPLDCAQGEVDWETLKIKGTCTTVEKEFLRLTGVRHLAFPASGVFHPVTLLGVHAWRNVGLGH